MNTYYDTISSPIGTLMLLSNGAALTGLYMDGGTGRRGDGERGIALPAASSLRTGAGENTGDEVTVDPSWIRNGECEPIRLAKDQLKAYFAGELKEFDLPLNLEGTPFQKTVWKELCNIPFGVTISYGELAARIGNPKGSRAAGLANGKNPISIIVPCHRVIGANGKLVGYGGGLDRKVWLLNLERAAAGTGRLWDEDTG